MPRSAPKFAPVLEFSVSAEVEQTLQSTIERWHFLDLSHLSEALGSGDTAIVEKGNGIRRDMTKSVDFLLRASKLVYSLVLYQRLYHSQNMCRVVSSYATLPLCSNHTSRPTPPKPRSQLPPA